VACARPGGSGREKEDSESDDGSGGEQKKRGGDRDSGAGGGSGGSGGARRGTKRRAESPESRPAAKRGRTRDGGQDGEPMDDELSVSSSDQEQEHEQVGSKRPSTGTTPSLPLTSSALAVSSEPADDLLSHSITMPSYPSKGGKSAGPSAGKQLGGGGVGKAHLGHTLLLFGYAAVFYAMMLLLIGIKIDSLNLLWITRTRAHDFERGLVC
jgi:hypothetical protein